MELYVLDDSLRRTAVIDKFESLIWTDRFTAMGDFELVMHSTSEVRALFTTGTRLATNESKHVMVVETVKDNDNDSGQSILTVSGRSLENILEDRIARISINGLTYDPRWALAGTPGAVAREIFNQICVVGALNRYDIIPFITSSPPPDPYAIPESTDLISVELEPATVYEAIKDLCERFGMGFSLIRNMDLSQLHFMIYKGVDRTSNQAVVPPVIFSPDLESLSNVTELVSTQNYKNVAYVFSPEMCVVVHADGVWPAIDGFERRVIMLKVDTVTPTASEAGLTTNQILVERGRQLLSQHTRISVFDGEVPKSGHKAGVDYNLGDIVEMQRDNGSSKKRMRVTELIFVSDVQGDRAYPTLSVV